MDMNRQFVHIVESKEVPISSNECRCECRPPRAVKQSWCTVTMATETTLGPTMAAREAVGRWKGFSCLSAWCLWSSTWKRFFLVDRF